MIFAIRPTKPDFVGQYDDALGISMGAKVNSIEKELPH
jgi:hypothetical protein